MTAARSAARNHSAIAAITITESTRACENLLSDSVLLKMTRALLSVSNCAAGRYLFSSVVTARIK
jgi:hypothetical protein